MPDQEEKYLFTIDDLDNFKFDKPYAEFRAYDEYNYEFIEQRDVTHGQYRKWWSKDEDFLGIHMNASFKNYNHINISWDGNPQHHLAYVYFPFERLEPGFREKLVDIINSELHKKDLDRFCEHLDEIGEKWSYTDDSKTCIECSYMNGGEPYQVHADGYYLRFKNADTFMHGLSQSRAWSLDDILEQEEDLKSVITTLQADDGRTLSVHKIDTDEILVSENGKNFQSCKFEPAVDGNSVIFFRDGDNDCSVHFKIYSDLYEFYIAEQLDKPVKLQVTQDNNTGLECNADKPIFTQYGCDHDYVKENHQWEYVENKNVVFNVYKIDENKNALIGGSYYGVPMKPELEQPGFFNMSPEEIKECTFYDISSGAEDLDIQFNDIFGKLDPKKEQPAGMYRFDKDSTFIIHAYDEAKNGNKTALISEQKDGQVIAAQWCKSDVPIDNSKEGKFYFETNGRNFLIPSDKIKPYKESFAEKVKGIQNSLSNHSNPKRDIKTPQKEEAIS